MYQHIIKRSLDFILAILVMLVLSPFFVIIALSIFIVSGKNPLFLQKRPGFKEKPFKIVKFRTMNNARDAFGELLPDEQRITKLGKWLRKTSVDELPQLWNVLIGKMSFIGPRPLLMHYLDLYSEEQKMRHEVKPGISGWAQVNGRRGIDWKKKLELDVWYVKNISFKLDLKILLGTLKLLVNKEEIRKASLEKMNRFKGENTSR